ncbi:MAG TPA: peptide ABC transporter substrate-binding protein [Opitutus sp.]|nr:peptide ABC transporter substrate-binding protein [Opitutus sp.]
MASFILAGLSLGTLFTSGCNRKSASQSADPQVLRISQRNEPSDLDPALATLPDDFFIIRALSEGLVAPAPTNGAADASGQVLPAAAERWEISADGLTYTFHLRPDAHWSNGDPVTAMDFVDSYRRVLTPATGAPKAAMFFAVKNAAAFARGALPDFSQVGFRAPDTRTLEITLHQPMPQFLVYVASGPWIPVNLRTVTRHGRKWTRPEHHVGNGPFKLTDWRPQQHVVVSKNPHYHAASAIKLDQIQFIAFSSGDAEDRAYRAGQIDITMAVPATKLEVYARERPAELHRAALAETRYLTLNTTRPPLDDVRVRRALALALDRRLLVGRVLLGGQQAAERFVPPMLLPAPEPDDVTNFSIRTDAIAARRLLSEAGFDGGEGFPSLELSSWPVGNPVLEVVQEMWKRELGIQVRLVSREAKVHLAALRDGEYDIGFITAIPDVPEAANILADFISDSSGNYPHWSDATFDALMSAADRDPATRTERLHAAESRLLQEAPLVPLYFNSTNWLMSPRVRGWQTDGLWTRFYRNVELSKN